MLRVVVDTNVVVSAALSPGGNATKILNLFFDEKIYLCYSAEILAEYREVLSRARLNIDVETRNNIVDAIRIAGIKVSPPASNTPLPDESDRKFYDAAKQSNALLITGNIKHFPNVDFALLPADFLAVLARK